jgi:protein phosphatase
MDAANFAEMFKFYSDLCKVPVDSYLNERTRLVFPIVPFPILQKLLVTAARRFAEEDTVLSVNQDVIVVGDIHGHILDLFRIIAEFGDPPIRKYLFLGDFVDRGEFSTETIIFILTMKVLWPSAISIIRGNHEFAELWQSNGFFQEVNSVYPNTNVVQLFADAFAGIPLAAIVNKTVLAVHGGIGPSTKDLSTIKNLYRPIGTFSDDEVADLVWSDPTEKAQGYTKSYRGAGHLFGADAVEAFLSANKFSLLVRGHECVEDGCHFGLNGKVATVFSASSYCNKMQNSAGVLVLTKDGGPPRPCVFPALSKYLLRANATFNKSDSDTQFDVKIKNAPAARASDPKRKPQGVSKSGEVPALPLKQTSGGRPGSKLASSSARVSRPG